jgi:recombination protein RecT
MSQTVLTREALSATLTQQQAAFAALLPRTLPLERFLHLADLAVRQTPEILQCSERSVIQAVYQCARHGLEPGVEAYLLPFGGTCTFVLSYRGTVTLLHRLPEVQRCFSEVVHEHDAFDLDYGRVQQPLSHRPALANRGQAVGAYGAVVLKDGGVQVHYLDRSDLDRVRRQSRTGAGEKGPWKEHWGEMARKVALKITAKQFPLLPAVAAAFEAEEAPVVEVSAARAAANVGELFDRSPGEPEPRED